MSSLTTNSPVDKIAVATVSLDVPFEPITFYEERATADWPGFVHQLWFSKSSGRWAARGPSEDFSIYAASMTAGFFWSDPEDAEYVTEGDTVMSSQNRRLEYWEVYSSETVFSSSVSVTMPYTVSASRTTTETAPSASTISTSSLETASPTSSPSSSPSSSAMPNINSSSHPTLSIAAKVIIGIGAVTLVLGVLAAWFVSTWLRRRRRRRRMLKRKLKEWEKAELPANDMPKEAEFRTVELPLQEPQELEAPVFPQQLPTNAFVKSNTEENDAAGHDTNEETCVDGTTRIEKAFESTTGESKPVNNIIKNDVDEGRRER